MIMKNIVGILVLMVVSTNVMSEWTKISDTNHANRTPYVEYHSILKKDNKVKMSTLTDFKKAEKYGNNKLLSMVTRDEYDCEKKTIRLLDIYGYSGNMQNGDIVFSNANITEQPKTVLPGSNGEGLLKIACGGK